MAIVEETEVHVFAYLLHTLIMFIWTLSWKKAQS